MRTLIVYETTYGYTEECVRDLAQKLTGDVQAVQLCKEKEPNLAEFDQVVIGGSIYVGQIQKTVKAYCIRNLPTLLSKKIGLFLCCGFLDNVELNFKNAFPVELLAKAAVKECFGGRIQMEKLNFLHKTMTKMVAKSTKKEPSESAVALPEKIDVLAATMNQLK